MSAASTYLLRVKTWFAEIWYRFLEFFVPRWQKLDRWIDARFGNVESRRDNTVAHGFKSDAVAIEEAPVSIGVHAALYVVLTLLVVAILWSIFGSLDRIVVAQGKIATRTPMIVMQPFTTSRILQVKVKAGDHVRKGQILVLFDPAFAQADQAALEHKVRALTAQVDRLTAEMQGTQFVVLPTDDPERQMQGQIFNQETAQLAAEMSQRDSQVAALNTQIRADNAVIEGLRRQLEMSQKVVAIYQRLLDQKAGAPLDVMRAESSAIDVELRLKNTIGDAKKLSEQRAQVESERQAFLDKWRGDHNQQLVVARQDLSEASQTLNKAKRMSEFTEFRAPVDGTILELADRSTGSVLREAETLVTLVPDNAVLYIEANIQSRDVSYLRVGNTVRVKLESYPFQRYGTLDGRLEVISPDSVPLKQDDQTSLVYRAQVRLTQSPREIAGRGIRLRPGLVATAEIKTGKRSIASYVLNPILRTADEGMKEP
jgi:hemolysin D